MDNSIDDFAEKNWPSLKKDLKKTVGDTAYNNWIKYLAYISLENNIIIPLDKIIIPLMQRRKVIPFNAKKKSNYILPRLC